MLASEQPKLCIIQPKNNKQSKWSYSKQQTNKQHSYEIPSSSDLHKLISWKALVAYHISEVSSRKWKLVEIGTTLK